MRNETVSVVNLGLNFLNVGGDVEDLSDCLFVTTPKIAISPAQRLEVRLPIPVVFHNTDTLTGSTLTAHEIPKAKTPRPWYAPTEKAE